MKRFRCQLHLFQTISLPMKQAFCQETGNCTWLVESANVAAPLCSHPARPQGRPAQPRGKRQQQLLSKCDTFQQVVQSPSCQDWCLIQRWNHDRGRTPTTSSFQKNSPSSCLKRSLCQIRTLLQPEEAGAIRAISLSLSIGTSNSCKVIVGVMHCASRDFRKDP